MFSQLPTFPRCRDDRTGVDLYTVQKLLGYKTNVMTQRYAHMSENRLRDAAKALSLALRPKKKAENSCELVKIETPCTIPFWGIGRTHEMDG
jgi:hypothetical protein